MKWKDELMAAFRKLKGAFESPLKLRPVTKREELKLNNAADRPALLDLIGQKESNGKYNAFYGNANNEEITPIAQIRIAATSVAHPRDSWN